MVFHCFELVTGYMRGTYRALTGSLFPFTCYLQDPFLDLHVIYGFPFSIDMLFTRSLSQFIRYLQAPFFNLHVIYRLPFSIYMLFADSLFRFTCNLQPPFFDLQIIYRLSFSINMLLTCYLQYFDNLPVLNSQVFLRVLRINHKTFTAYLQYSQEQFTSHLHDRSPSLWKFYSVFAIIYMFHLKYLHVFYMDLHKHVKGEK